MLPGRLPDSIQYKMMWHSDCRYSTVPAHAWEELLAHTCPTNSSSEHVVLLDRLSALLNYLNLPGPVIKWLPPVEGISIRHARLLRLHQASSAVQQAESAVQLIMDYKPFSSAGHPSDVAAFVLLVEMGGSVRLPQLTAYAVPNPPTELVTVLARTRDKSFFASSSCASNTTV